MYVYAYAKSIANGIACSGLESLLIPTGSPFMLTMTFYRPTARLPIHIAARSQFRRTYLNWKAPLKDFAYRCE